MYDFKLFKPIFIVFAFCICLSGSTTDNYCCSFDGNLCFWNNIVQQGWATWTWSSTAKPDTTDLADYQLNTTPNNWLQNKTLNSGSKIASKASPNLRINKNDVISIEMYRHTPGSSDSNRLVLKVIKTSGASTVLIKATKSGWQQLNVTCDDVTPCCDAYPCTVQFQIEGTIENANDLLAFDEFSINNCAYFTTPSPNVNATITVETTTITIIKTVVTTTYDVSTPSLPITTSVTDTNTSFATKIIETP